MWIPVVFILKAWRSLINFTRQDWIYRTNIYVKKATPAGSVFIGDSLLAFFS
jgi:hypothetical protein